MPEIIIYYPNHILKTASLSSTARILLDVLILGMRAGDNLVYYIEGGMEAYIEFYGTNLNKIITQKTIQNATTELVRAGILKRIRNGQYNIDKNMFLKLNMKDTEEKHVKWTNSNDTLVEESQLRKLKLNENSKSENLNEANE